MKKIKVVILIIALILGSLNVAYASTISPLASTISPLNNAVNDVKVTFTISEDGTSNSTITVSPMRVGGIDYITITASIIKRSTSSKVKTWNSVRVEEHPYVGNFIFNKNYELSASGVYYLEVTSMKCYKNGILVDDIGPIRSLNAMF